MSNLIARALTAARDLWHHEPARVSGAVVIVVLFVASKAGFILDPATTGQYVAVILTIVLGGEAARKKVVPLKKLQSDPDALPADQVSRP